MSQYRVLRRFLSYWKVLNEGSQVTKSQRPTHTPNRNYANIRSLSYDVAGAVDQQQQEMIRAFLDAAKTALVRPTLSFFRPPTESFQLCLSGIPLNIDQDQPALISDVIGSLWFAAPKERRSRGKKRQRWIGHKVNFCVYFGWWEYWNRVLNY